MPDQGFEHIVIGLNLVLSSYILLLAPRRRVNQLFAVILFVPYIPHLLSMEVQPSQSFSFLLTFLAAVLYLPFQSLGLAAIVHFVLVYPKRTRLSLDTFKQALLLGLILYDAISLAHWLKNGGLFNTVFIIPLTWLIYGIVARIRCPQTLPRLQFWRIIIVGALLELLSLTVIFILLSRSFEDTIIFPAIVILVPLLNGMAIGGYMRRFQSGQGEFITLEQWANWGRWQIWAVYFVLIGAVIGLMILPPLTWQTTGEYTYLALSVNRGSLYGTLTVTAISLILITLWKNYRQACQSQRALTGLLLFGFTAYHALGLIITMVSGTLTLNLDWVEFLLPLTLTATIGVAIVRYHFLDSALNMITQAINSTLEIDIVLNMVMEQLNSLLDFKNGGILLLAGNRWIIRASTVEAMVGHGIIDECLADELAKNGSFLAHDVEEMPDSFRQAMLRAQWSSRSWVAVPLIAHDQVIGLISVSHSDPHRYDKTDLEILFPFACQVAVAVDNARLYESQKQRTLELAQAYQQEQQARQLADTLLEVTNVVGSTLNLDEVLMRILEELNKVLPYDKAMVLWRKGNKLYTRENCCRFSEIEQHHDGLLIDKYANINRVVTLGEPLIISDTTVDHRWIAAADDPTRSWVGLPLMAKGQVAGLLSIKSYTPHMYSEANLPLVAAFANQVAMSVENARLYEMEIKQLEQEFETARQIQVSLLPSTVPELNGLHLAGISRPARHVGGDFYNYFVFDQNHLGVAVGDVSGKGMQAALMMALSFGLLTNGVRRETTPSALLNSLNSELRPHTQHNRMNTAMSYLTMEHVNGDWKLNVANAGLISPLVRRRDGTVTWLDVGGLPLGMVMGVEYLALQQTLWPGDLVFLSSDGIVEAMNVAGKMYGFDRLAHRVTNAPLATTALELQEWVLADVYAFVGQAEPHDDMTIVVVQV